MPQALAVAARDNCEMENPVIPADRETPAVAPAVVPGDSGENCEMELLMPPADREYLGLGIQARNTHHG